MTTSVYKVQCKTFSIARNVAGDHRTATPQASHTKPPFCLRILRQYRTPEMQAFRDTVASKIRELR